jgi:hypothetical protein
MPAWLRYAIVAALTALAVVHLIKPALAIDTTFLGLVGLALVLLLFDPEGGELFGFKFRKRKKDVEKARKQAEMIQISQEAPTRPSPPEPGKQPLEAEVEHKEPFDLWPPSDSSQSLFWAAEQIRIELVVLMGNSGTTFPRMPFPDYQIPELAFFLIQKGYIPAELLEPIRTVVARRNEQAHGTVHPPDLLELSVELAYDVLGKLRKVSRYYYRVRVADIKVYPDRSLTTALEIRAVMIATLGNDGGLLQSQVFPASQKYHTGRFVTWEWTSDPSYQREAWYQDPKTKKAELAWSSIASFVGREYPEQWALEYRFKRPDVGLLETYPA